MIEPCEEVKRVEQRYEKVLDDMEKHYKDVFDKIRDEIEKVFCMSVVTNELRTPMEVKAEILQIIDKYR